MKDHKRRLSAECKSNPKYFWKYVLSELETNTGISSLLRKDGQMAVSDAAKADVMNTFFFGVGGWGVRYLEEKL